MIRRIAKHMSGCHISIKTLKLYDLLCIKTQTSKYPEYISIVHDKYETSMYLTRYCNLQMCFVINTRIKQ